MFTISDLPELVADYASGEADWMIAYSVLLRLLGDHEVSEIMAYLSPELADRFASALHEEFRDAESAKSVLWIDSAAGEPPNRDQIIASIVRWLERSPATSS